MYRLQGRGPRHRGRRDWLKGAKILQMMANAAHIRSELSFFHWGIRWEVFLKGCVVNFGWNDGVCSADVYSSMYILMRL